MMCILTQCFLHILDVTENAYACLLSLFFLLHFSCSFVVFVFGSCTWIGWVCECVCVCMSCASARRKRERCAMDTTTRIRTNCIFICARTRLQRAIFRAWLAAASRSSDAITMDGPVTACNKLNKFNDNNYSVNIDIIQFSAFYA